MRLGGSEFIFIANFVALKGEICPICGSHAMMIGADDPFSGFVVKCGFCLCEDFVFKPLADRRVFGYGPQSWCLV